MKKTHLFILLSLVACGVINGHVVAMEEDLKKKYRDAISKRRNALNYLERAKKRYVEVKGTTEKERASEIYEKAVKEYFLADKQYWLTLQERQILEQYDNLYKAIKDNDIESVYNIIADNNININAGSSIKDLNGSTPLHYAVILDRKRIVQALINNGANPNIKDKNGRTPLHYAAIVGIKTTERLLNLFYDNKIIGQILLDNGADLKIEDNYHNIPRYYAVKYKHAMIVKLFDEKVLLESQKILDETY